MLGKDFFYHSLITLSHSPKKAEKLLKDPRLSLAEKGIITAQMEIRDNRNEKAIATLSNMPPSPLLFIEAQRNLILGVAYNNTSRFIEAGLRIQAAIKLMQSLECPHALFVGHFNLFILSHNTHDLKKMHGCLEAMKSLPFEHPSQEPRLLRCQFLYHSELGDYTRAREYLALIHLKKKDLFESDLISHLVAEFIFYIALEEFTGAKRVLGEMKKHRKFQLSQNFKFMKALLAHLLEDAPIYIQQKDLDGVPILQHQLAVIQALEACDLGRAQRHWGVLSSIQGDLYHPNFLYLGRKGLFSLCLAKHQKSWNWVPPPTCSTQSTLANTLIELLKTSEGPLSRDALFAILYGRPPADKEDYKRLSRLVSRVKGATGLNIRIRKGNYVLETLERRAKAS